MKHAQKAATKTKTQGLGGFRFINQGRVAKFEPINGVTQILIGVAFFWKDAGKDHGLNLFVAGQGSGRDLSALNRYVSDGVAHTAVAHFF